MSDVLHAAWLPALKRLVLWGAATDPPPRTGRRASLPELIDRAEFERLAKLKQPLVQVRASG